MSQSSDKRERITAMEKPNHQQQLFIITTLLRFSIWMIWIALIAVDGLGASINTSEAVYWLPFIAMGLFMAWMLDGFIRDEQLGRAFISAIPYLVLADFVQG